MGLLRVLLALGVATEHAGRPFGAGSYTAVEAFFVISGFYMSLIYGRVYSSARDFYASRFFRLYPVYWLTLVVAVAYFVVADLTAGGEETPLAYVRETALGVLQSVYLLIANVLMIGSDATWFMPQWFSPSIHSVHFLAITPIWTLSLELVFYALCPLVLRLRSRWLVLLIATAFAARAVGYSYGLADNPWHSRFIGFEIAYFLLGVLAHRAYLAGGWWLLPIRSARTFVLVCITVLAAVMFNDLARDYPIATVYHRADYVHSLLLYALIVVALPGLYEWTRHSSIDRWIGEHSYPIYIWHYPLVDVFIHSGVYPSVTLVLVLTVVHAILSVRYVQMPVDAMRHRRYRKGAAQPRVPHELQPARAS